MILNTSRIRRFRLDASTMVELLTVMLISGVLFLAVMEGMSLFTRFGSRIAERITVNSRFYDAYFRLGDLISSADSLTDEAGGVSIHRSGLPPVRLRVAEGLLLSECGGRRDTLFTNAVSMERVASVFGERLTDSVKVELRSSGGRRIVAFATLPSPATVRGADIEETEREYGYE